MQLQFLGGASTVTGSRFLLKTKRAEVLIDAGRSAEAIVRLEAVREERRSMGNAVGAAWCDLHLSRAYAELGRDDDADVSRHTARAVFDAAGFDDILERAELLTP